MIAAGRTALLALACVLLLVVPAGLAMTSFAPRPHIVTRPVAFPAKRKTEMQAYAKRHYGLATWQLRSPKVIVEHITVSSTFASAFATFNADVPDAELQQQCDRPYFKETIGLPVGEIYVSALDLNQEHGAVERPYLPTLRIATPLRRPDGKPFGIVVVNVDMRPALARVRASVRQASKATILSTPTARANSPLI